jgi:Tol biopolymer transport system component
MAPEQLDGRAADVRGDVFALGAVLFEMAAGRRAFAGDSTHAIAGAVLAVTPPLVSTLRPDAPPGFDRLVSACLEKDPDKRWQSAHDVALLLRSMTAGATEKAAAPVGQADRAGTRWLPWALTAVAAGLAVASWLRPPPADAVRTTPAAFTVPPPAGLSFISWVEGSEMALSPDGTRLAVVASTGGVWLRPLGSLTSTPVIGAETANALFWSPDGRSIAFFGSGMLKRVEASGGVAVPLCNVSKWTGHSGSWGSDGIVFSAINGKGIFRVPLAGGTPSELVKPEAARHELRLLWPHFLPDGKRFLYTAFHDDRSGRLMLWESDREPREIMPILSNAEYVEPGLLLFVRDGVLLARRFDAATATVTGDPVAVAEPVDYALIPGLGHFTASRNGVLAYQPHRDLSRVAWVDRTGRELATVLKTGKYQYLRLSADGRMVIFDRTTAGIGTYDLWSLDLERGSEMRLTSDQGNEIQGIASRDRSMLVYSAGRNGPPHVVIRDAASGAERALHPDSSLQIAEDITPDGAALIYRSRPEGAGSFQLLSAPLKGGPPSRVFDTPFTYVSARFSPSGDWLAYADDEAGPLDVYVARWPLSSERVRVSTDGGGPARWSRDGRELFYQSAAGLMSVPMSGGVPGRASVLLDRRTIGRWSDYDVAADGRFLAIVAESFGGDEPLTVMTNWRARVQ